ncbi:MAG: DUF3488 and DUF4129 domain-containing transglutaminase family protein [Lautropia sp.]
MAARASRWSFRALGGRLGAEWERDRRDTLFLMGAVFLSVLPQMGFLPPWCTAGFVVLFAWRLGLLFSGRPLPGTLVRWLAAAAILIAVFAQYRSIFGREAGVALLVLFLGLKLMEMRARRDLFVVIFLCCFLLLTGYFHSQGIWMAAATLAALFTLVASMLTMQFRQQEIPVSRRFRYASVLLLQALPIAAALFVLFPRASGPLWGLPGDAQAGKTGLSESMSPGDLSELAQSDAVVMRVQFDGAAPPAGQMYWRGPTFGDFDGRTWRATRYRAPSVAPQLTLDPPHAGAPRGPAPRALSYRATVEPANHRWLITLEMPTAIPQLDDRRISITPTYDLVADRPLIERFRFDASARLDARIGVNETAESLRNWLALPPGFNPRTRELAATLAAAAGDAAPRARVEQALDWLRAGGFSYTLSPPTLGRDSVDDFLFGSRAGFCEHFSNAFVVLMRQMGIPARVVTGYQGAEHNRGDDYWIVRQSDAHAWAEVWLDGVGWRRVDPTAVVAPDRIQRGSRALRALAGSGDDATDERWTDRLRLNLDAIAHGWNQWVLSYDRGRQMSLFARLGIDFGDWREIAGAVAGFMALVIGAVALAALRPQMPKDPAERCFDEFCQRVAALGLARHPYETPNRFYGRIEHLLDPPDSARARGIVEAYNRVRYDRGSEDRESLDRLRHLVKAFRP